MQTNRKSESAASIFLYLAILTACFLLLEISYSIQCNSVYIEDFHDISQQLTMPRSILPGIMLFGVIQLGIHLFYLLLVFGSTFFSARLLGLSGEQTFKLALGTWLAGIAATLSANQYYFPNSTYSYLFAFIFPEGVINWYLTLLFALMFFAVVIAGMIGLLVALTQRSFNYALLLLLACGGAICLGLAHSHSHR